MYNALQSLQAFEAGTGQRKERERETAMKGIGNALAGGDIAGATSQAFAVDPMYGMQIQQYGDQRNALATRKEIGGMIGAGDRKGAAAKAYGAGELEMGANIDAQIAQMTQQQRQDALFLAEQMGSAAMTLQSLKPEQRAAQWPSMQQRFITEFGMDPAALQQFNPMDDADIADALGQAQTFAQRLEGQRWQAGFDREGEYRTQDVDWRTSQAAEETRRWNAEQEAAKAEREAKAGAAKTRPTAKDQNGVLRYLDGAKEPVFPGVEAAPKTAEPLIGAESMARVAAGLPTAKEAVAGIRSLVFDSKGTWNSAAGYDPGSDFGAGLIQDLGHFPVVGGLVRGATEPLSRIVGGADYQKFEDSYSAYEAAILPIMSGAAVTDTEALRQLRAVRIKSGDNEETKQRKVRAMELQVQGLEMAARGDVDGFLGLLDQAGEIAGTGPVDRGGTTTAPPPKPTGAIAPEFEGYTLDGDPITEDDIQTTMRENGMTREQVVAALMGEGQ